MANPIFQHRQYKAIAAVLADASTGRQYEREAVSVLIVRIVDMFANDNPRFDRERFIAAAAGMATNVRDERV